ncbi:MAG: hypothetical protein ABIV28_05840 [Longimicrobiales bacterium]
MRRLRIRERTVPIDDVAMYGSAWTSLQRAAQAAGARAWVFRATEPDETGMSRFIEFVEWLSDENDPSALHRAIAAADANLKNIAAASDRGTWEEWTGS